MSSLVTRIKRAFWSRVVLKTDRDYRFELSDEGALACHEATEQAPDPLLVLVGRAHCYELRSPIPNVDAAEASKIAKNMPVASPFGQNLRRNRLVVKDDGTSAHITLMRHASVADFLKRPLLLMPVMWVVDRLLDEKPSVVKLPGEIVGIAPSTNGYQSRLLDGSDGSENDFWWSSGHQSQDVQRFDGNQFIDALGVALRGLSWRDWLEALWRPDVSPLDRLKSVDWRMGSMVVAAVFSLYMIVTSAALVSTGWILDRQLANEPDAFTDVLALRAETNRLRAKDGAWSSAVGEQHPTWAVWPPVLEVWGGDVVVTGLTVAEGNAEVFMSASKATSVLTQFKQSPYVTDADFGMSVRRDRRLDRDTFSIVWTVADPESVSQQPEAQELQEVAHES